MSGVIHEAHEGHEVGMEGPYEVPPGWVWRRLGEVALLVGGGTPSRQRPEYFGGNVVWLTPTEIPKDRIITITDSKEHITQEGLRRSSARLVGAGAVLMTSRASIGYVAIAGTDVTTNQGFATFVPSGAVHSAYLAYWLWSQRDNFIHQATGTTFKEITKSKLRQTLIPLVPYPQQRRIVAKIEELFSALDAGVASLRRVQAALKRYRAAVLKAACEGRLVPQNPNDEPAEKLLERILAERRAKWEADLRAKGKDSKKAKYEEPKGPDTERLPELPEGWCWATLEQLSWDSGYGTSQKCEYDAPGPPVLRIPNVVSGDLDLQDLKRATDGSALSSSSALAPNDMLIIRTNGSKDLIGRSAIVRQPFSQPHFFASYLIRYRLVGGAELSQWLSTLWNSDHMRKQIERMAATSAGQYNVSVGSLNRLIAPLPPGAEQPRIVAEVERRLSVVSQLEKVVEANLVRGERLRQAILRRAFEGKLTDPMQQTEVLPRN